MKKTRKRMLAVSVFLAAVLGLTACGNAAEDTGLIYDEAALRQTADTLIYNWAELSAEEISLFADMDQDEAEAVISGNGIAYEADAFTTAFAAFEAVSEDLGPYVSTIGYEGPEVSGDEITLNIDVQYENREAEVSFVFDEDGVVQSVDISPHYTMSEILYKAVMNTMIGMGTVFLVLIFISLVIYCFKFIPAIQDKAGRIAAAFKAKFRKKKKAAQTEETVPVSEEPVLAEEKEKLAGDAELAAAITAAICAYEGTSADGFVVRSIRRAERPSWNRG